jgi:predicted transcriptional regulator
MVKMTFTLDDVTVDRLRRSAARLAKPRSEIVRLAIRDYAEAIGRLSEEERTQALRAFDEWVPRIPRRPQPEVDREIRAVRAARRRGGRAARSPR